MDEAGKQSGRPAVSASCTVRCSASETPGGVPERPPVRRRSAGEAASSWRRRCRELSRCAIRGRSEGGGGGRRLSSTLIVCPSVTASSSLSRLWARASGPDAGVAPRTARQAALAFDAKTCRLTLGASAPRVRAGAGAEAPPDCRCVGACDVTAIVGGDSLDPPQPQRIAVAAIAMQRVGKRRAANAPLERSGDGRHPCV